MARNKNGIPTAEEEALQQPTIDPLFLLASMGLGGFEAGPIGYKAAMRVIPETMEKYSAQDLLKMFIPHVLKRTAQAGANFAGGAELNHFLMPNHPLADNALALPLLPEVTSLRRLVGKGGVTDETKMFDEISPYLSDFMKRLKPALTSPILLRDRKKNG
jgi:hypothetical protein